jgi:DNA-binding IclR family transcriptional regulator
MARPSPGTQRVVDLLNFFAEHPGRAFSLTDLIRALKINRATCHSLLAVLVQAGYLYRTSDKNYVLGPAVARLTKAAATHVSPLQIAFPEMRQLADAHDVICMAISREGGDAVVSELTASVSHLSGALTRGARWPLRPPFAAVYLANAAEADANAWLDSLAPPPSEAERAKTKEGIAFVSTHGFQYVVRSASARSVEAAEEWLFISDLAERPLVVNPPLDKRRSYQLTGLSSPVFDKNGHIAFVLSLSGFAGARSGADIAAIGAQVSAASQRITAAFPDVGAAR